MTKVSLILTTYNSKDNLIKTLRSIEEQDYPDIEIIIKDGGSTDETVDVIRNYQEKSRHAVIWKSRPDTGIYDAMNQGYELSTGEVIVFFNDLFTGTQAVRKMMGVIKENPSCVGAHADLVYKDGDTIVRKWHMGEGDIYQGWMPGHPTLFLKREIYEKYGLYDTSYKISADYEFMIRFLKEKKNKLAYLPETIVSMFYGGTSNQNLKSYLHSMLEGYKALCKNDVSNLLSIWITMRRTIKVLGQF